MPYEISFCIAGSIICAYRYLGAIYDSSGVKVTRDMAWTVSVAHLSRYNFKLTAIVNLGVIV